MGHYTLIVQGKRMLSRKMQRHEQGVAAAAAAAAAAADAVAIPNGDDDSRLTAPQTCDYQQTNIKHPVHRYLSQCNPEVHRSSAMPE
jgi:hypothetical protein